ncbi:glycine C-acetyltransferase [Deinococcus peraridilitoris]|uniref:Pyridoxal phosphate-dependent acyltransferase, putative n=1 Tax=Deinococcus peraridilitoris (strain DSM 19664 / LMG 22246 / CIP 109416 / KR-200) TaxID=937777 RepID=L0A1U7_DEIPD|nr:glycine C-acetyltransferase [Deinococcus peraridilitoris]AFZ67878.1 pyridoxal phosphate-dependent acyltransferase, putative [Deinococcus peraridilitoris DSM 19664]
MTSLTSRIDAELQRLRSAGLYISPRVLEAPQRPITRVLGREVVNLASNNYLGFADHPFLKERARQFLETWGAGVGAVRTIAGTLSIHEDFETQLAEFKGTGSALVLHSGFTTNQGVLGSLLQEGDLVVSDELNHASIIDGLRLAKATKKVFKHKDMQDLERVLLENPTDGLKLIVTDGVFSMDGDIAPLDKIVEIARRYGAVTYVDDAHGSGVLGEAGRGTVHHFGFEHADDVIQIGTLSKAWGVVGGYAAGTRDLRDLLINKARPFLFSTGHPPAVVGALSAAVELIQREPHIMETLWDNTRYFKAELSRLGFDTFGSETPITPVIFGETGAAFEASRLLLERGVFAVGIGFPTVPRGSARIRNIVTAAHTRDMLDRALAAYEAVGRELGVVAG